MVTKVSNATEIEKLHGSENFLDWKFAVKTLLELDDLWKSETGEDADARTNTKLSNTAKSE